jgi:hypothetical protein
MMKIDKLNNNGVERFGHENCRRVQLPPFLPHPSSLTVIQFTVYRNRNETRKTDADGWKKSKKATTTAPFVWNHRQKFIIRFYHFLDIFSCYKSISHIASHKLPNANAFASIKGFGFFPPFASKNFMRKQSKAGFIDVSLSGKSIKVIELLACDREMIFFFFSLHLSFCALSQFSVCASQFERIEEISVKVLRGWISGDVIMCCLLVTDEISVCVIH